MRRLSLIKVELVFPVPVYVPLNMLRLKHFHKTAHYPNKMAPLPYLVIHLQVGTVVSFQKDLPATVPIYLETTTHPTRYWYRAVCSWQQAYIYFKYTSHIILTKVRSKTLSRLWEKSFSSFFEGRGWPTRPEHPSHLIDSTGLGTKVVNQKCVRSHRRSSSSSSSSFRYQKLSGATIYK